MALGEFIRKQFIDVIEWLEGGENLVAWRYPMRDQEIQNGAQLTVREGQLAVFVDEGRLADVFGPGRHRLSTATLPLLTNLRHWDKLFASPFKSDVVFLSTRQQLDRRWGTRQPVALRDRDFGAVRVRAHGNFAWRVGDAAAFLREVLGTRAQLPADEVDEPLRALLVQHLGDAVAESGRPFLDLAANQVEFAAQLLAACRADAARLGLVLEAVTVQSVSLPEELQKLLDQRIGMAMVGPDMGRFVQYQTGQALPALAAGAAAGGGGGGGVVGDAMGLGAGVALGQMLAQQLQTGAAAPAGGAKHAELLATLEKLGELHAKGVLTDAEFGAKKAELLARLG
ncbi:MAG: SPFH domain-containing protein [Rubrivivax sp.]|nr:SPFH domain-containing protein [Rubrivivax sp.]